MGKAKTRTKTTEGSRMLTYTECAIALEVSESTVSRMVTSGRLPGVRLGTRRLVPAHEVEQFRKGREQAQRG